MEKLDSTSMEACVWFLNGKSEYPLISTGSGQEQKEERAHAQWPQWRCWKK